MEVYFIFYINKFRIFIEFVTFYTTWKLKSLEDFHELRDVGTWAGLYL